MICDADLDAYIQSTRVTKRPLPLVIVKDIFVASRSTVSRDKLSEILGTKPLRPRKTCPADQQQGVASRSRD